MKKLLKILLLILIPLALIAFLLHCNKSECCGSKKSKKDKKDGKKKSHCHWC